MLFSSRFIFGVCAVWLGLALGGCSPGGDSSLDDEKEPHFVIGKNHVNGRDYAGAIEAFEESLVASPHSAPAHYQLAMLYENAAPDPAAAIYHYQQYLKFDPKAENAEVIAQRINSCKQQLASAVLSLPSAPAAQKQIENLVEANHKLQEAVTFYSNQLAAARMNPLPKNNFVPPPNPNPAPVPATQTGGANPGHPASNTTAAPRTHKVADGETLAAIARIHKVSLAALQTANPGLNPKKLRVGQLVNLP